MATTIEMFMAGLALIVNTLVILLMYFVGNIVISPIINGLSSLVIGPQTIPISDTTYLMPAIWAVLLCMEVIIIIAFFIVAARRTTIDTFEY